MFGQLSTCQAAKSQALKPSCLVWVLTQRFLAKKSGVDPNFLHFFRFLYILRYWKFQKMIWCNCNLRFLKPFWSISIGKGTWGSANMSDGGETCGYFPTFDMQCLRALAKSRSKTHWSNNQVLVAGLGMLQWPGHSARQGWEKYTKH